MFNKKFKVQVYGAAMGSTLGPVLTNIGPWTRMA